MNSTVSAGLAQREGPRVSITSDFWSRYRSMAVRQSLPYQWRVLNDEVPVDAPQGSSWGDNGQQFSHSLRNLRIAAGLQTGKFKGQPFQDTDVSKWLEAASYALRFDDGSVDMSALKAHIDEALSLFYQAQDSDGYLDTKFEIDLPADKRFKGLRWSHELYTMGHFIEAAVANFTSTGSSVALDIARRAAHCIDEHFGDEPGKIHGPDGHPEIELALARLYEVTGEQRWLDLAAWFIRIRGVDPDFFDRQDREGGPQIYEDIEDMPLRYFVADGPAIKLQKAGGHAVRLIYYATATAKVGKLLGDSEMIATAKRLWNNIVDHRMYVTGNVGSCKVGESFTYDDDLPNGLDYGETCASVGMLFYGKAMMDINPLGSVADVMELELFNGMLAGVSLDGTRYFYVNPLEADPQASLANPTKRHILTRRAGWFDCACCPANLMRLLTSLDTYLYTVQGDTIYAHQFIANTADFGDGFSVEQTQEAQGYPWIGEIDFRVRNPKELAKKLAIRIPSWSKNWSITVNGKSLNIPVSNGFVSVSVSEKSTHIHLSLDMSVRYIRASNRVRDDVGKLAVARGPVVFCMEQTDNQAPLWLDSLSPDSKVGAVYHPELLDGVEMLTVEGARMEPADSNRQYQRATAPVRRLPENLNLIPYYAWCNRSEGQMEVWIDENH
ncbi:beta-L-arabinofuranosidase domain-containing protein [Bifidobacterium sp. ESL0732]|uniref:glycoside hydrolase family 127 protein n=1 Tax=Bifidobacterium sp. ESL0732 TaxID=2983222 RepID=UPI0023F8CA41|nr:beta-L-arabinofuranosidase domain-containing protein [Bifidobacterium sp. ESL0732]WEV63730.1 glycoside hydrolase family 127 protein [Bifidobacterium sp. ESL0732]